jgi:hypothetical protein
MPEWMDEGSPYSATILKNRADETMKKVVSEGTAIMEASFLLCESRCNHDPLLEPKTPVFFI